MMAKSTSLSPALKSLISAPFARPGPIPAPPHIRSIYADIYHEAVARNVGLGVWLTFSTAATMTINSPISLTVLYNVATEKEKGKRRDKEKELEKRVWLAEMVREVGLKCISFNGIPRTINTLAAFRCHLPADVKSQLSTTPTREPTPQNLPQLQTLGQNLWSSIYTTHSSKLLSRLSNSHPDLPIHVINSHYAALLSDPPLQEQNGDIKKRKPVRLGRILTSVLAIACLRAQSGVGAQVTSHVFGLRRGVEEERGKEDGDGEDRWTEEGKEWLGGDEGNVWVLESVDQIVKGIGGVEGGTSFAPGVRRGCD